MDSTETLPSALKQKSTASDTSFAEGHRSAGASVPAPLLIREQLPEGHPLPVRRQSPSTSNTVNPIPLTLKSALLSSNISRSVRQTGSSSVGLHGPCPAERRLTDAPTVRATCKM
jgi:hypothetical protein